MISESWILHFLISITGENEMFYFIELHELQKIKSTTVSEENISSLIVIFVFKLFPNQNLIHGLKHKQYVGKRTSL